MSRRFGTPLNPRVRALVGKELRQVGRSRGALVSATLLPILFLLVEPIVQLRMLLDGPLGGESGQLLFRHFGDPRGLFLQLSLPLFVTLAGVLAAPVLATHTVVAERERGTLHLLMALPASVEEILLAKILGVLVIGAGIVLPIFALEVALLLGSHLAGIGYALRLTLVLLGALICSAGVTTIVTLVARDYRTSRQLSGIPTTAVLFLTIGILFVLGGSAAILTLAAVLAGLGAACVVAARQWLTFERYIS
jgi:ABC-type transport system involved in multi-copper enzyme maturation permease subunit